MNHYYKNFLTNPGSYVLAEAFWRRAISRVLKGKKISVKQWLATKNNLGEKFYDGDPIFSLIDNQNKRALRIVQLKPKSAKPLIKAWVEKRLDQDDRQIDVLAVALELSEETKLVTLELVEKWFVEKLDAERFNEQFINNLIENVLSTIDLRKVRKIRSYYLSWFANESKSPSENIREIYRIKRRVFFEQDKNTQFYNNRIKKLFADEIEKTLEKTFTIKISGKPKSHIVSINPSRTLIIYSLRNHINEIKQGKEDLEKLVQKIESEQV